MVKAKSPYPPTLALLIKQQFHLILDNSTFFLSHTRVRITKCSKLKTQANGDKAGFELSKFSSEGNKTKLMNYSSLNLKAISFVLGCVQTDPATNFQHCWRNNVGSCCVCVGSGVQTDATTLSICWVLQCIVGRIQPISLCKPCVMSVHGRNNVKRAVQTVRTLLRYASVITEQKKCWELLAEKFDRFQTLHSNMQQGVETDATCNIQQCWELLVNNVASVCTQPYTPQLRCQATGSFPGFCPTSRRGPSERSWS